MRIVGGNLRGKRLGVPAGDITRPTSDRVRENLFNILSNHLDFEGLRVMDLFAGSGALGMEALSRGAGFCLFVEKASRPVVAIEQNIKATGVAERSKLMRLDVTRLPVNNDEKPFDLAFADPPYDREFGAKTAASLVRGGWLVDNGLFILEESSSAMPNSLKDFNTLDIRTYGGTAIGLFELAS